LLGDDEASFEREILSGVVTDDDETLFEVRRLLDFVAFVEVGGDTEKNFTSFEAFHFLTTYIKN